ncbi:hypothetical protein GVY41_09995 [Frigidibacter albus]|uniref:Glycosyl transferase CAP10 domain-containing protein n=1 Tax=Frigidibacter albus TaxID=1465486 RepID=A0A6L8VI76_9RHOB|nr:glycosyl transferase family 90 [Frigidibacter albus]MZQ89421.1 hypothetical protein [Frigidibacter albus]NBE31327.1 hypothetical protein [Frigidibacter albus]GGH54071.1 hypothetical protein GCM10011341_20190 [Frigidibacter albus]
MTRIWVGGRLAEDLAYARATGAVPLATWPRGVLFGAMNRLHKPHLPPLQPFRDPAFLRRHFPDCWLLLPRRDREAWVASRWHHDGGQSRRLWALHLGCAEAALPGIWRRDWDEHHALCNRLFAGDPRFRVLDMDGDWAGALATAMPDLGLAGAAPRPPAPKPAPLAAPAQIVAPAPDLGFAQAIADFCTRSDPAIPQRLGPQRFSALFARWDGAGRILGSQKLPLPIVAEDLPSGTRRYLAQPGIPKLERVEGAVNELWALGHRRALRMDLEDRRGFGTAATGAPRQPLLVYNRPAGGTGNMLLWPLPGYHTPGAPSHVTAQEADRVAWADKADVAAWRGNLSGRPVAVLDAGAGPGRGAHLVLADLARGPGAADAALERELLATTRYSVVRRFAGRAGFDLGVALPPHHAGAARHPLLAPYCGPRMPPAWFHGFRYLLSLSGRDGGSNFLPAAQTQGVVLKEEDGWELFYSGAFHPWEHFIPLAPGAVDLEERLEWARGNPAACQQMSKAARDVCARIANAETRRAWLRMVAEAASVQAP